MRFKRPLLLGLLLALLLQTGCWDRKAAEDLGFVTSIGLDSGPDNTVIVTVQIENPRAVSAAPRGGSDPVTPPVVVQRVQQPTVTEALRDLETFTNRRISLVQTKIVVFGRDLAMEGMQAHLGVLTRSRELRRNIQVMVADGTAEDVLTAKPALERDPSLFLEDLARRAYERTARAPRVSLHDFLTAYERKGRDAILPMVRKKLTRPGLEYKERIKNELSGTAVFRGPKMVGELGAEETETLLLLTGNLGFLQEAMPVPGAPKHQVVFALRPEQRRVTVVTTAGSRPQLQMQITAEGELRELEEDPSSLVTPEGLRELEDMLARQLTRKSTGLIRKLQTELKADAIGFGDYLRVRFIDWPSWEAYDWPKLFPEAEIKVTVDVILRRAGMTFHPVRSR